MEITKPTIASIFLFSLLGIVGCVNPYRANFNSTRDRQPTWIESHLAPPSDEPQIRESADIQSDNWRMFEQGYVMVGFSKFDAPLVDMAAAMKAARAAKADVVLFERKFSRTLTETVTVTQFPPSETTEIREDSHFSGARGQNQLSRRVEVTTHRGPETQYVPRDVDYYQQSATFWRKVSKPLFGAFVQDLTEEQKQQLQTNRGLVVRRLMVDSPAYKADLLVGDIILAIGKEPVPSARKFYEDLIQWEGKTMELALIRNGKQMTKQLSP